MYLALSSCPIQWLDIGLTSKIDELIRRYRLLMDSAANEAASAKVSRELAQLVFGPIQKVLPGVQRFFMSPHGALHLVPFGALLDEGGEPLLKKYQIISLSASRDLALTVTAKGAEPATIGGSRILLNKQRAGSFFQHCLEPARKHAK